MNLEDRLPNLEADLFDRCLECDVELGAADIVDFKGDKLCYDCAEDRLLETEHSGDPASPESEFPLRGAGFHRH